MCRPDQVELNRRFFAELAMRRAVRLEVLAIQFESERTTYGTVMARWCREESAQLTRWIV